MSYLAPADGDYYTIANGVSIDVQQKIMLFGAIKLIDEQSFNRGLIALSTSATDGRVNNTVQLQIRGDELPFIRLSAGGSPSSRGMGGVDPVVLGDWVFMAIALGPFDGNETDAKFYLRRFGQTETDEFLITLPDYGVDDFLSVALGDGSFTASNHRGAYLSVYPVDDLDDADQLFAHLHTIGQPTAKTPFFDAPFLTVPPGGAVPSGSASLDTLDNPSLEAKVIFKNLVLDQEIINTSPSGQTTGIFYQSLCSHPDYVDQFTLEGRYEGNVLTGDLTHPILGLISTFVPLTGETEVNFRDVIAGVL